MIGFFWSRQEWCRVELLSLLQVAGSDWAMRSELVFADAAAMEFDGRLDNETVPSFRPVHWPIAATAFSPNVGRLRRFRLSLPRGQLSISGRICQVVALNSMKCLRLDAGATPKQAEKKSPKRPRSPRPPGSLRSSWPRIVSSLASVRRPGLYPATLVRLQFTLSGDCRLRFVRFSGTGCSLRLDVFDLVLVRARAISGKVRLGDRSIVIKGIDRRRVSRRDARHVTGDDDGHGHVYTIRTEAGRLSILAEDCLLVPS